GANRASDIEAVLRFAEQQKIRVVIRGAAEGWLIAKELAAAQVPVIIDPLVYGPGGFRQTHARPDNAALLHKAGVVVVVGGGSSHNARLVRQAAGNAVREGLDHEAALRMITQTPAEVFGLKDRGQLQPGAVANVVVWAGDPLELTTSVRYVIIGGTVRALDSRQWQLMLRYKTLPGTPAPALSLPEASP
ncbi:MAG: imidazolonepropionase-like amidohydrolase, partial [Kiritimatiellia bacterium]